MWSRFGVGADVGVVRGRRVRARVRCAGDKCATVDVQLEAHMESPELAAISARERRLISKPAMLPWAWRHHLVPTGLPPPLPKHTSVEKT